MWVGFFSQPGDQHVAPTDRPPRSPDTTDRRPTARRNAVLLVRAECALPSVADPVLTTVPRLQRRTAAAAQRNCRPLCRCLALRSPPPSLPLRPRFCPPPHSSVQCECVAAAAAAAVVARASASLPSLRPPPMSAYHAEGASVPPTASSVAHPHHSRSASSSEGLTVTRQNVHDMSAQLSAVLSAKASQKAPGHAGHHAHQPSLAVHYAGPPPVGHEADSLTENMERLRLQS